MTVELDVGSILLVDDDASNLHVLHETLKDRDYRLLVAKSGEQAMTIAARAHPALMLLDIMMPGMDGFETLSKLKAEADTAGIAVIFLSALDDVKDKVKGLQLGAVDYIAKPFDPDEVIARVETHMKILRLEQNLARQNRQLEEVNKRMQLDLEAAFRVQESFLPKVAPSSERARFAWTYHPCEQLGGDFLSVFAFDDRYVGMYVVDVCGHGVPSSLLAVTIAHSLNLDAGSSSLLTEPGDDPRGFDIVSPARVAAGLNRMFPMDATTGLYFTMLYGILDTQSGEFRFVSAGHPGPLVVKGDGSSMVHEVAGRPIGLWPESDYTESMVELSAGDRIVIYSDGLSEERNPQGEQFGDARMQELVASSTGSDLQDTLQVLEQEVAAWGGGNDVRDDVAILAAEIIGQEP